MNYMTYGVLLNVRVVKCKITSVGTGHSTKFSSCFCFLNYLPVAKKLKTTFQLKEFKTWWSSSKVPSNISTGQGYQLRQGMVSK